MPPIRWAFLSVLLLFAFALLVSDTAACLASGLARCLAFAATTVLCALAKILSFNCFDMFHNNTSKRIIDTL